MSVDVIGDFLTIIRNGIMMSKRSVVVPFSILKNEISKILLDEGFIDNVVVEESESGLKKLYISLRYVNDESVIHEIKRISKPGRRFYANLSHLKPVIGNLGISILTTNKGIVTNKTAKKLGIGGEIICTVW